MCVGAPRGLLHTLHWVHISLALYPAALAAAPAPQMPYLSPASCSSVSSKLPAPCSDTVTERPSRTAKRTACEYCPASGGANVTVTFCVRGWPKPRPSSFPPAGDTTNWPKRASDLAAAATSSAEPGSFTLPAVGTAPHVASTSVGLLSVSSSTFGACTCTRPNSRLAPSPGRASAAATCSAGCNTVPDTGSRCTSPFPYVTTSAPSRRKSSAGNSTGPLAAAVSELRRRRAGDARVREGLVRPAAPGAASWGTNCRVTSTLSAGGRYVWPPNEAGAPVVPWYKMGSCGADGAMPTSSNGPSVCILKSSGHFCRLVMVSDLRYESCCAASWMEQQVRSKSVPSSGSRRDLMPTELRSTRSGCNGVGGLPAYGWKVPVIRLPTDSPSSPSGHSLRLIGRDGPSTCCMPIRYPRWSAMRSLTNFTVNLHDSPPRITTLAGCTTNGASSGA
mmetsp:Transcript_8081/g.24364  ORF Transcript_8081/g.24364 Transcript_8081/m.24364 type:complete len:448 (-) Transcript_8081:4857-6200(-)